MSSDSEGLLQSQRHGDGQAASSAPIQEPTDKAWALAFKLNLAITILSGIYGFSAAKRALGDLGWLQVLPLSLVPVAGMLSVPSVYAVSWILLQTMVDSSRLMVQIGAVFSVLICALGVDVLLDAGIPLVAAGLAIVCALIPFLVIRRRGTIQCTASNMKAAALAINSTPNMMSWALFMMGVRAVWLVAGLVAVLGSVFAFSSSTRHGIDETFLLKMLVWGLNIVWQFTVIGNVVAATVASCTASWCSSPDNVEPVWVSFRRVLHVSLGSLSRSAMTEDIVRLFLLVLAAIFKSAGLPIFGVCLAVKYLLGCTVAIIGMKRLGFSAGLNRAVEILRTNGLTIVINNTLMVSGIYFTLTMICGAFAVVGELSLFLSSGWPSIALAAWKHAVGIAMVITFEVVVHACNAVFVNFIQDPEAFAEVHGDRDPDGVYRAWRQLQRVHPIVEEAEAGIQV